MAEQRGGAAGDDILDLPAAGPTVIRGGVLRIAGYVAGALVSALSVIVLTRYLSVADFGRYTQVVALVTLVAGLTDAGMTSMGVREYSVLERAAGATLLRNLLGIRIVLTFAGVAIALAFGAVAGYSDVMLAGIVLAGAALGFQVAQGTIGVPLQSGLRLGWVTAFDLLRQGATVLMLLLAVVAGAGLAVLLAAPLPVAIALLVATGALVRGQVSLAPAFDRETWRRLLALTLPFAAATAVGAIYVYVTIVLMSLVATEQETGIFGAAFRVFAVIVTIPGLLVMTAFPVLARAARDDGARLSYAVQRLFEVCLILGVGVALVTFVAAPTIIDVVAGRPKYDGSVAVLRIQAIALLASFFVALGGFTLLSLHRHRALLIVNGVALASAATLTLVLAGDHGAVGTAYANVVGETVLVVGYLLGLRRGDDGARVSFKLLPRVALAAAAGIGVAVLVVGLQPLLAAALGGAAYAAALVLLRAVPVEIYEALRRR